MARTVKTPGAATTSEPTVEDVKTPEANQPVEQQPADTEAKNKALEGQLRRAGTTKPTEAAKADAVPTDGSPYLSDKGWTRGA